MYKTIFTLLLALSALGAQAQEALNQKEKTYSSAAPMPSITYEKSRLMIMSVKAAPNAVRYFRSVVAGS